VVVFGEDVGLEGRVFRAIAGLQKEFGEERCFDTPIAKAGIVLPRLAAGRAWPWQQPPAERGEDDDAQERHDGIHQEERDRPARLQEISPCDAGEERRQAVAYGAVDCHALLLNECSHAPFSLTAPVACVRKCTECSHIRIAGGPLRTRQYGTGRAAPLLMPGSTVVSILLSLPFGS